MPRLPAILQSLSAFQVANFIEAAFWITAGAVLIAQGRRVPRLRQRYSVAAITLIFFGFSDVVEAFTGAWWRPWWLLLWKAGCLLVLLIVLIRGLLERRRSPESSGHDTIARN